MDKKNMVREIIDSLKMTARDMDGLADKVGQGDIPLDGYDRDLIRTAFLGRINGLILENKIIYMQGGKVTFDYVTDLMNSVNEI